MQLTHTYTVNVYIVEDNEVKGDIMFSWFEENIYITCERKGIYISKVEKCNSLGANQEQFMLVTEYLTVST